MSLNPVEVFGFFHQIQENLCGLQRDMRNNAMTHLAMAQARSPDLPMLVDDVKRCAYTYGNRLAWVTSAMNKPEWPEIAALLPTWGWTEDAITEKVKEFKPAIAALASAPISTFTEIQNACQAFLDSTKPRLTLWQE